MTAREKREQRARLAVQARAILDAAEKETRALTAEEDAKFNAIHADMARLKTEADRMDLQAETERELGAEVERRSGREDAGAGAAPDPKADEEAERAAFRAWLLGDTSRISPEQRAILQRRRENLPPEIRALTVGTGASGGYTVPTGFSGQMDVAMKAIGGLFQAAEIIPTDAGNDLPWPTATDTANSAAILGENTAAASNVDPTFGSVTLKAYNYATTMVLVPIQLLQDSAFNIEAFLARILGERIGRGFNAHGTTGTGTNQPQGVVTAAALGKTGANGQTTSIIYDDLADLVFALDPAYRLNAKFMMNDSTLAAISKIKGTDGQPLWTFGVMDMDQITIMGRRYPIVINQSMAVMAASAKSVLFGDFGHYKIRKVKDVVVMKLVERYADSLQVGFIGFCRMDGRMVDASGACVKYYANSAT